jgi:hypothetical protein
MLHIIIITIIIIIIIIITIIIIIIVTVVVFLKNIFLLFFPLGETESTWYCGHYWHIVLAPDDRWWWMWSNRWNEDWQGKLKYSEKTCPNANLSTTNPAGPDPGSNQGRCGRNPATNRLSYGTAFEERITWGIYAYDRPTTSTVRTVRNICNYSVINSSQNSRTVCRDVCGPSLFQSLFPSSSNLYGGAATDQSAYRRQGFDSRHG